MANSTETKMLTVNLPKQWMPLLEKDAQQEERTVSSLVRIILRKRLEQKGLLAPVDGVEEDGDALQDYQDLRV